MLPRITPCSALSAPCWAFGKAFKIVIAEDTQTYLATRNESNYALSRIAVSIRLRKIILWISRKSCRIGGNLFRADLRVIPRASSCKNRKEMARFQGQIQPKAAPFQSAQNEIFGIQGLKFGPGAPSSTQQIHAQPGSDTRHLGAREQSWESACDFAFRGVARVGTMAGWRIRWNLWRGNL